MDASSLSTASTYVNNLLLARGLLSDGRSLDFTALATTAVTTDLVPADRPLSTTKALLTAQTINLIHSLILRQDRHQEQLSGISSTLQTLRAESQRSTLQISRLGRENAALHTKVVDAKRAAATAEAALHASESAARLLREDVARAKSTLAQVRTTCAADVRRRDVETQKLKGYLTDRQRGAQRGRGHVAHGTVSCEIVKKSDGVRRQDEIPSVNDVEYSLKQETTEFLTELSAGLSDENDALLAVVRGTLATLKELSGLQHARQHGDSNTKEVSDGLLGDSTEHEDSLMSVVPQDFNVMQTELQHVLHGLRDLLSNPSFAPIEEVQIREEEIQRLREGWEKMEARWREAVQLMQGWRKRMLSGGSTIGLEELGLGLRLGAGFGIISSEVRSSVQGKESSGDDRSQGDGQELSQNGDEQDMDSPRFPEDESSFDEDKVEEKRLVGKLALLEVKNQTVNARHSSLRHPSEPNVIQEVEEDAKENRAPEDTKVDHVANTLPTAKKPFLKAGARRVSSIPTNRMNVRKLSANSSMSRTSSMEVAKAKKQTKTSTAGAEKAPLKSIPKPSNPKTSRPTTKKMTVEEKLAFAEHEARRISGTSCSPSSLRTEQADECKHQDQATSAAVAAHSITTSSTDEHDMPEPPVSRISLHEAVIPMDTPITASVDVPDAPDVPAELSAVPCTGDNAPAIPPVDIPAERSAVVCNGDEEEDELLHARPIDKGTASQQRQQEQKQQPPRSAAKPSTSTAQSRRPTTAAATATAATKRDKVPRMKRAGGGKRRRSTLSPEELAGLMGLQ